jgi:hypothetical protein
MGETMKRSRRQRKAKPVKTDEQSFVESAAAQFASGDFLGILTLADFLDEKGEHPDAASFFRRVASEGDADVCHHFARSEWVSLNGDTGPDFLLRKIRRCYEIAVIEDWVESQEIGFLWEIDPDYDPSREQDDWQESHNLAWYCTAVTPPPEGAAIGYGIGGITFGGDGHPDGDPYKRDIEAELAVELFEETFEFYRQSDGDYCVIQPDNSRPMHEGNAQVTVYDGRGAGVEGDPGSVQSTSISSIFLDDCIKVDLADIPADWRRALIVV